MSLADQVIHFRMLDVPLNRVADIASAEGSRASMRW
jgi:hypothetical protein